MRHRRSSRRRELLPCERDHVRVAARRCTAHLAAPQRRRSSPAHRPAVLVQPNRIPQRMDDRPGGARVPRGHPRRGRAAVQYALRQRRRDRRGRRAVDQRGLRGKHRTRAVAGWGPDACGQCPHRACEGALRGTARSARRDGRRGAPGGLLTDDRGERQLTTTASTATDSARSETMSALPHTVASPPVIGPVPGQERIEAIDILRGVAILGILIVNMGLFSLPEGLPAHQLWPNMVDRTAEKLILFFAQEKFKTLFSFLFGLGLAVQMMRAEARGARFLPLYLRRLSVLLLIGLAHFLLLWSGDILHDYALNGFILLLFRRRPLKTLLVWAGIFLCIPLLFFGLTTCYSITRQVNPQVMNRISFENPVEDRKTIEEAQRVYSRGTYVDMIKVRVRDL